MLGKDPLPPALENALRTMVTQAWEFEAKDYQALVAPGTGVTPGMFVEAVAVAAMTVQVDTFNLAMGQTRRALPKLMAEKADPTLPKGVLDPKCQTGFNSWIPVFPPTIAAKAILGILHLGILYPGIQYPCILVPCVLVSCILASCILVSCILFLVWRSSR